MTMTDVSLLLAMLGGTCLLACWIARRTGDAARDAWLMGALGGGKLALALVLWEA